MATKFGPKRIREVGRSVLEEGAAALQSVAEAVDNDFVRAVRTIGACEGRLVVTGMGKAGFVARKISSTFASTGTPSLFVHPADAVHGDLGRITSADVVLALSHSGETEEMLRLIGPVKRVGASLIAITAARTSGLGSRADVAIEMGHHKEAGNGLAPTTSTTVMLGIGDALAMCVLRLRGFTRDDFALFHPGGTLGRKLMRVDEVMRRGEMVPVVKKKATLAQVIKVMTSTRGRPGAATVVDSKGRLVGLFTDGDLRRLLDEGTFEPSMPVSDGMTQDPKTVRGEQYIVDAARLLSEYHVDQVPVVDDRHRPVGLLDVQDLLELRLL